MHTNTYSHRLAEQIPHKTPKGVLEKKKKYWKPLSSQKYLQKKFRQMAFLFSSIALFIGLSSPSFAFAAPNFEISQCDETSCSVVNSVLISPNANQTITIRIGIKNPDQNAIYSVQSWLKYNPQVWEVVELSDEHSDFELAAPGEFKAKADTGEIRIGRAVAGTAITSPNAIVADITLKSKKDPTFSTISWIDFISNDIGKTAIVGLNGNAPINLLSTKPKDITFNRATTSIPSKNTSSNNISSGSTKNVSGNTSGNYGAQNNNASSAVVQNQGKTDTQLNNPSMNFADIPRPNGLRSRTHKDGSVDHLWQMGTDPKITGYYLYYSTSSGVYMHRRDVGKTNTITFPSGFFEKGKRVYFAVQAYTSAQAVSDFSDETYLVVGTVGSESHPFFEQIFPNAVSVGVSGANAYYGKPGQTTSLAQADLTGSSQATANKSIQAKPKTNTQSGIEIPPYVLLILGGIALLFSRRFLIMNKR